MIESKPFCRASSTMTSVLKVKPQQRRWTPFKRHWQTFDKPSKTRWWTPTSRHEVKGNNMEYKYMKQIEKKMKLLKESLRLGVAFPVDGKVVFDWDDFNKVFERYDDAVKSIFGEDDID